MKIEKRGFKMPVTESFELAMSGFPQKGHWEEIQLTDEDRELHARAVAAYEEVQSNPWVRLDGYEFDFGVAPLEPGRRFVPAETSEEHMARWIAAGRPDLHRDGLLQRIAHAYAAGVVTPEQARGSAFRMTGAE